MGDQGLAAWKLPVIVSAIAISIVGGFYLGGPGLGMAVGALAAATIVAMAVRNPPRRPIEPPAPGDGRDHLLVVVEEPLEDGAAIEEVAAAGAEAEVLVLAPVRNSFLDRWACETGPGRERAQRNLVLSLASLAAAGVAARACVGDEDLVQSVADRLQEYPATEVLLVSGAGAAPGPPTELRSRLRPRFRQLTCPPAAQAAACRSFRLLDGAGGGAQPSGSD
ncbi:MAG TPA: hypothetical protein VFI17_07700 [Solirubrobacterales bacterium]|nr:hypothetical protein [Solirubrobacterales bacterium]